jgi:hypothetical protein
MDPASPRLAAANRATTRQEVPGRQTGISPSPGRSDSESANSARAETYPHSSCSVVYSQAPDWNSRHSESAPEIVPIPVHAERPFALRRRVRPKSEITHEFLACAARCLFPDSSKIDFLPDMPSNDPITGVNSLGTGRFVRPRPFGKSEDVRSSPRNSSFAARPVKGTFFNAPRNSKPK